MQSIDTKTRTLSLRLLRRGKRIIDAIAQDYVPGATKGLEQRTWAPIEDATVFVGQLYQNAPPWREFVSHGSTDLPPLTSSGSAAILFIPVDQRVIAVCFGYAHIALDLDAFEKGFGLRVTLNSVPRAHLRTLDLATPDAITFQRRVQASRDSDLRSFGVDMHRDLARVAGGTPKNQEFASFIAGKDSLSITCKASPDTLLEVCQAVMAVFRNHAYKEDFGWIDNLERVQQKDLVDRLDAKLMEQIEVLRRGGISNLHMTPPEIVDYTDGDVLRYNGFGGRALDFHRLSIEDYVTALKDCEFCGDIAELKAKHKIKARKEGSDEFTQRWRVYNCLVYETELESDDDNDTNMYVFFAGDWFKVEKRFKKLVEDRVNGIPKTTIVSSTRARNELELIDELELRKDLVKLDRQSINPSGIVHANLEPCDFFSDRKQFIHLKDGQSSGPISHLWMQGVVSAEAFVGDKKFRSELRRKVKKIRRGFEMHLPDGRAQPVRSDYEIVYGVMREPLRDGTVRLPFFSQVSLYTAIDRLEQLGFKVALNLITKKPAT